MTMLLQESHDQTQLTLREFARERWALLLSHPNDFRLPHSTPEGFITRVRAELDAARVCIISTQLTTSWLDRLDQSAVFVKLEQSSGSVVPLAERTLRMHLGSLKQPYAVIVDQSLRVRATIHYRHSPSAPQCISELVDVVQALRDRPMMQAAAAKMAVSR